MPRLLRDAGISSSALMCRPRRLRLVNLQHIDGGTVGEQEKGM